MKFNAMIKRSFIFQLVLIFFASCNAQTNEEKIEKTSIRILSIIEKGNVNEFENIIGHELSVIGKNKYLLSKDFEKCQKLYVEYVKESAPKIQITGIYNELGNRLVIIPFFEGVDSINNISKVQIKLLFGPPNFISLDKISGYEIYIQNLKDSIQTIPVSPIKKVE